MTVKGLTRREERARLRRPPGWKARDAVLFGLLLGLGALYIAAPGVLADLGDTVLGSTRIIPALGLSLSGLLAAFARLLVVTVILVALSQLREAPWRQRAAWTLIGASLLMEAALAWYSGSPLRLSTLVQTAGLGGLLAWLSVRPTIWQQMRDWKGRAEKAEAELERLKRTGGG